MVDIIRHKYLRKDDFLSVPSKSTASFTWRSILKGRDVLLRGLGINISNGQTTRFWMDNWMQESPLINHATRAISDAEAELFVAWYCDEFGGWNWEALSKVLPLEIVFKISAIWINTSDEREDSWCWKLEGDGSFSTSSAYKIQLSPQPLSILPCHKVWSLSCLKFSYGEPCSVHFLQLLLCIEDILYCFSAWLFSLFICGRDFATCTA